MRQEFKDCLNRGKIILFPQGKRLVDKGLLDADLIEAFNRSMRLREGADYRNSYSQEGAILVVEKAEHFLTRAEDTL